MHIESAPRRRHSISLAPLIDVVFILLVFFMLATSFTDWRPITLATAKAAPSKHSKPPAVVHVAANGRLTYNQHAYPAGALASKLMADRRRGDISAVIVAPDANTTLDVTVHVLDTLAGADVTSISLAGGTGS